MPRDNAELKINKKQRVYCMTAREKRKLKAISAKMFGFSPNFESSSRKNLLQGIKQRRLKHKLRNFFFLTSTRKHVKQQRSMSNFYKFQDIQESCVTFFNHLKQ